MKSIQQVSKQYKITPRTLRYYEEIGILQPVRNLNSMRFYSKREEVKIKLILRGKNFGFSLEEIKEMVLLFDSDRTGEKQLVRTIEYGKQKIEQIDEKIEELYQIRKEIEELSNVFAERLTNLREEKT